MKNVWAIVTVLSRSQGKRREKHGLIWCPMVVPCLGHISGGWWVPGPSKVLADAAGASRLPGRRRGKSITPPNGGASGTAPALSNPPLPAACSILAISISPGQLVNKCLINHQEVFFSWTCVHVCGGTNSPDEPWAGGRGQGAVPHSHTIDTGVFISTKMSKYIAV